MSLAKILNISDEAKKYIKCWDLDAYRRVSPGENVAAMFMDAADDIMPDWREQSVIDFGCGTGRGGYKLWQEGMDVTLMDFAPNCLDAKVEKQVGHDRLRFVDHDITEKTALRANWAYCCDVMEHLPEKDIDKALGTIFEAVDNCFFNIATVADHFGSHPDIAEPLHLTVWDYDKWLRKFSDHGVVVHRSFEAPHNVIFLVSGYNGFAYDKLKMNTDTETVFSQIRTNVSRGLQQLKVYEEQPDQKVVVLAGGPSLNDYVDEIKEHKKNGAKIITMNGTYAWAKEHDLWPVTQFMLDAREFNKRFVDPVDEQNLFILASQVHPAVIDKLPPERTWLFQGNLDPQSIEIVNEVVGPMYEKWYPITGGSTIMLRTLPALFTMGFRDVEIYGFDSCYMGKALDDKQVDIHQHHAFAQPENDVPDDEPGRVGVVTVAGKSFAIEGWMLCQAKEFIDFKRRLLGGMKMVVHGEGLVAHCLAEGLDNIEEE